MLLQAARDAASGDPFKATDARRWLRDIGFDLAEILDFAPERVKSWLESLPQVEEDLARCHYPPGKVTSLLGVSFATLRKLKESGLLIPDAPSGQYSALGLLSFLWGDEKLDEGKA